MFRVVKCCAFGIIAVGVTGFFAVRFSPVDASDVTVLDGDTEWESSRSVSGAVVIRGLVTIPAGIRLTIAPGSEVLFDGGNLSVEGAIDFRGTTVKPITVASKIGSYDGHTIAVSGNLRARHTTFRDGGTGPVSLIGFSWMNTAYAVGETGVIAALGGSAIDIAHCRFAGNETAISVGGRRQTGEWQCESEGDDEVCVPVETALPKARVWASVFASSGERKNKVTVHDAFAQEPQSTHPDFRYNYWNGEEVRAWKNRGDILGSVNVDPVSTEEDRRDPVIFVPGLIGSWQWTPKGEFLPDPVMGTYDSLVETFAENGYVEGRDFFLFGYDWRQSNEKTALAFGEKLKEVRASTEWPLVDVVAHSMGGLVVRAYVDNTKNETNAEEDIDEVVTLGTPNKGAPESYLTWEDGDFNSNNAILYAFLKFTLSLESHENGYDNIFSYVRGAPIVSIQELLPVYDYLTRNGSDDKLSYPDGYPRNTFLEKLSSGESQEAFRRVTHIAISGQVEKKTIVGLRVGEAQNGSDGTLWKHGKPDGYDDIFGDHGLVYGAGDGTVPRTSNDACIADDGETVEAFHGDLPDAAREAVFREITGHAPGKKIYSPIVNDLVVVQAMSPIDLSVTDANGRTVGSDPNTGKTKLDIPGAFYTGGDAQSEFVTIPNPPTGTLVVSARGTDAGAYGIRVVRLRQEDATVAESTQEFSGTITKGEIRTATVVVNETGLAPSADTPPTPQIAATGNDAREEEKKKDDDEKKSEKKTVIGRLSVLFGNGSEREDASEEGNARGNETRENGVAGIVSGMSEISTASEEMFVQKSAFKKFVWYVLALFFLAALLGRKRLRTFARDFVRGWKEVKIR